MEELFKKLSEFESSENLVPSSWSKVNDLLAKRKRRKRFIVLICFGLLLISTCTITNTFRVQESTNKNYSQTLIHKHNKKQLFKGLKTTDLHSKNESNINHTSIDKNVNFSNSKIKGIGSIDRSLINENSINENRLIAELIKQIELDTIQNKVDSISKSKDLANNNSVLNEKNKLEIKDPLSKSNFNVRIGVKTFGLNALNTSSTKSQSIGIGAFISLSGRSNKFLGYTIQSGVQTEFNHDLKYSYISESSVFLNRVNKNVTVITSDIYKVNTQFILDLNWTNRFSTNIGSFINIPFQTKSTVNTSTSSYNSIENDIKVNQFGYSKLLNPYEIGFSVSQTYITKSNLALTLGLNYGITNRLNSAYFTSKINRFEVNFQISKSIKSKKNNN